MSEILRGKCGVSGRRAQLIARRLNWDIETATAFQRMAESESSRSPKRRMEAKTALHEIFSEKRRQLTEMEFRFLADWYHLAALSLAEILGGRIDTHALSYHLAIAKKEAEGALDRLAKMDLLECIGPDNYKLRVASTITPSVKSSAALRSFHGQMLEKARVALDRQTNETRDNSAIILTVKKENLDQAKNLIREFRKNFIRLVSVDGSDDPDSVYCFSLQLFELAHSHKSKKGER